MTTNAAVELVPTTADLTLLERDFIAALQQGARALKTAGDLLVKCLAADPLAKQRISVASGVGLSTLNVFERIGRNQLHCDLFLLDVPASGHLARLPYSDQERYLHEPVELLVGSNGNADVLRVEIRNLTPEQARQVFALDHVRDLGEQRAWLAQQSKKGKTVNVTPTNYRIKGDAVEFLLGNGKLRVTRAELLRIAAEMER